MNLGETSPRTGIKSPGYQEEKIYVAPITGDTGKSLKMYPIIAAAGAIVGTTVPH